MLSVEITPQDIDAQVRHWLNTPVNSYLGSSYGSPLRDKLQRPQSDTEMDDVIAKLLHDLPVLSLLPEGSVNIYEYQGDSIEGTSLVLELAGRLIDIPRG